jgi:hypothetical protein
MPSSTGTADEAGGRAMILEHAVAYALEEASDA